MPDQDYMMAGEHQWNKIQEELSQAHATFAWARNNGDSDTMGSAVQKIAKCNEDMNALRNLHAQVVAQEQARR
jgi:hypothetical protein